MKKLLYIAKAIKPDPGGIEEYSHQVARAWSEIGYEVNAIAQFIGEAGWHERQGYKLFNIGKGGQLIVFIKLLINLFFNASFRAHDIIHCTTWRVAIPAKIVFPFKKIVVTVHGREVTEMSGILKYVMLIAFKSFNRVVFVSRVSKDQCNAILGIPENKCVVSWNGISYIEDAKTIHQVKESLGKPPVSLYTICRHVPRKNIVTVVRVLAELKNEGFDQWHYTIGSSGQDTKNIKQAVRELGLNSDITFLGRVNEEEMVAEYVKHDLFVHPQTSGEDGKDIEGFGLVIADAMSLGLPVLAGIDGAPKEFIKDGETAFLVNGYSTKALKEKLRSILEDRAQLKRVSEQGRVWAINNLSWQKHVRRIVDSLKLL